MPGTAIALTHSGPAGEFGLAARSHWAATADAPGPISYQLMAQDTIAFLETVVGGPADLVGCSDGAIVALLAALGRPDLVRHLVCVAGVFHRDGWAPGVIDPGQAPPDFIADMYAEVSPDGREHFSAVRAKLDRMYAAEPDLAAHDLQRVTARTMVMVGDDDEVTLEHAVAFHRNLPAGELAVIPGTSHGLLVEKPELCNGMIVDFLSTEPVPTMAPIRRAAGSAVAAGRQ